MRSDDIGIASIAPLLSPKVIPSILAMGRLVQSKRVLFAVIVPSSASNTKSYFYFLLVSKAFAKRRPRTTLPFFHWDAHTEKSNNHLQKRVSYLESF